MKNPLSLTICALLLAAFSLSAATFYVSLESTNPTPPYTNWATAATSIQDAVDASMDGDQILVTNGVYQTGGRVVYGELTNRLAITKAVSVQSVNGRTVTAIQGNPVIGETAIRCVYLTNYAALIGFTLTNGGTRSPGDTFLEQSGGAFWCESTNAIIQDCTIVSNLAQLYGGGAYQGTLSNCTLTLSRVATLGLGTGGGGAFGSLLVNCTLYQNSAPEGGGAYRATLTNCTITGNTANAGQYGGGGAYDSALFSCLVSSNSTANGGGGVYGGTLNGCTLFTNKAYSGGAAYNSALVNCLLTSNSKSSGKGGATYNCTLTNCTLAKNICGAGDGAAAYSTLDGCVLMNTVGPGAFASTLYNCLICSNTQGTYSCTLSNCTVSKNLQTGAYRSTLNACLVVGNSSALGGNGGGASGSTLNNCLVASNSVTGGAGGGGAFACALTNCTVIGNSATSGGGLANSTNRNCIVYYNYTYPSGSFSNYTSSDFVNCCTAPLPGSGLRNITNAPLFIACTNGNGNLRLQSNSPCINAGNNVYVATTADLDGNPRIVSGTVDIGAYEYEGAGSVISYAWLQQYGLLTDGSADYTDPDHDGLNNWQEWVCGTDPTNRLSVLRLLSPSVTSTDAAFTWQSVAGVNYFLGRSANLAVPFTLLATNIVGQAGTTTYTDNNATGAGPFFYRVGVKSP